MRIFTSIRKLVEAVATGIGVVLGLVPDPVPAPQRIDR
jgi:hypothetical protein